jgi:DNA-binding LytR/AlgR family response regulator
MIINCIAVDDEPLALGLVCAFIEQTPFLKLVGRYSNAVEALVGLQDQKVDLIFLDIQMPNLNGMELARVLDSRGAINPVLFLPQHTTSLPLKATGLTHSITCSNLLIMKSSCTHQTRRWAILNW